MIHTKLNLKNTKACILAALVLGCAVSGAYAQTLVTPTGSDYPWYTISNQPYGINTAMMAYTPGAGSPQYFFASAAYDGTSSYIYVHDPITNTDASIPSTGTMASVPDIIIGNNNTVFGSATEDFILATAYITTLGEVEVDYYQVHDDGSLAIAIYQLSNLDPSLYKSKSLSVAAWATVHIDVVADYTNTSVTGFAFCNKFAVTWDDVTYTADPAIYAALCDLGTQAIGSPVLVSPSSGAYQYGAGPDVSAIYQKIGSNWDYTVWIPYTVYNSGELYLTEYDFTAASTISSGVLDNGSGGLPVVAPRIDAFDNYTNVGSPAHYKVVAQASNSSTSHTEIRTYDNLLGYGSNYVSSASIDVTSAGGTWSGYLPPYFNGQPTVAAGSDYTVFHPTGVTSGKDIMFMEPIDVYTSAIDLSYDHFYWVNGNSSLQYMATYDPSGSVSTPPNDPTLATVYVYDYYNSSVPEFDVDYKITTGAGYAFRQAPTAVTNVQAQAWQVYPNPATSLLTVNNTVTANALTEYRIMDMAGQELLKGALAGSSTNINVNCLKPGAYAIQVYNDGELYGGKLFVKE